MSHAHGHALAHTLSCAVLLAKGEKAKLEMLRASSTDVNKFAKSHIKEQAKSSANHILCTLYNNIHNAPQPSTQPPQSQADEPTISFKKNAFDSYINDVVIKDIKGGGY